jgi:hypothetical protein
MIRALRGTGGIKTRIAERLKVSRDTVVHWLEYGKGRRWDRVRQAYRDECERVGDDAETTISDVMKNRLDLGAAANTAKWYLSRKHSDRGYSEVQEVRLSGGPTPIKMSVMKREIDIEALPLEIRIQILGWMEQKEAEEKQQREEERKAETGGR